MESLKNQKHYLIKIDGREINTIKIIESILDSLGISGKEAFHVGNVLKYVIRYKKKNGEEDLKKAKVYLDFILGNDDEKILKSYENKVKILLEKNKELEIQLENKINEVHNTKIDLMDRETELEELGKHISELEKLIFKKDNEIYRNKLSNSKG